jgi:hypothetical protein
MRNNVHFLYRFEGLELMTPPRASPDDRFQPIHIHDNSLLKICIRAEDVLFAHLNLEPADGRFSYVKTLQDFLLGYVFSKPDGVVKVESFCRAPCCPPVYLAAPELVTVAPIVRGARHNNGVTSRFIFDERRSELWET